MTLQETIRRHAVEAGFATAGIAPVPRLGSPEADNHRAYFEQWIAHGSAGEMEYLKRKDALGRYLRSGLELAVPWANSVIVCTAPYGGDASTPLSIDPAPDSAGWIARYAWSGRTAPSGEMVPSDYHKVLIQRLKRMEQALKAELGPFESWAYVDTGPMVERQFAAMAGVGWTGKNVCTLNQELGSFFFLGTILASLTVAEDQRATLPEDRCGSCTRCIDACPTNALVAPHQMDASLCIAYLTIEKRGPIEEHLRAPIGRQVFGCDICQDVCPWNGRARLIGSVETPMPELVPREVLINPPLRTLLELTEPEWERLFFGSPVKRTRYGGFRRNVAIAAGNSGDLALIPALQAMADSSGDDPTVRDAARWALRELAALPGSPPKQTDVTGETPR